MQERVQDVYCGWSITVKEEKVTMGGDKKQGALERAREMIDMEVALAGEE